MTARLAPLHGLWAVSFDGSRTEFTRYKATEDARKVQKAVERDFPGWQVETPASTGWLFELEELRPHEMDAAPLSEENEARPAATKVEAEPAQS